VLGSPGDAWLNVLIAEVSHGKLKFGLLHANDAGVMLINHLVLSFHSDRGRLRGCKSPTEAFLECSYGWISGCVMHC
jgi:hypothetical protein